MREGISRKARAKVKIGNTVHKQWLFDQNVKEKRDFLVY